jgi:hypothetical protein
MRVLRLCGFFGFRDLLGNCFVLRAAPCPVSMAETNCAKWRRESVPVGLREKGFEAPAWCFCVDLNFVGGLSFIRCF